MKQGTEMKINRLPVRTWNWLHMNESSLSDIDTVLLSRGQTGGRTCADTAEGRCILYPGHEHRNGGGRFPGYCHGMGPDMEELIRESGTPVEIIRVKKGEKPEAPVKLAFPCKEGEHGPCMRPMCMRKKAAASR